MTMKGIITIFITTFYICAAAITAVGQEDHVIDEVVAVVGKTIVLESDIQNQYINMRMQGGIRGSASEVRCQILEDILYPTT